MSTELIKARKRIKEIQTHLKQQRYVAAVQALMDGLTVVIKSPLMKNERSEFEGFIENAVYAMNGNKGLRETYPLIIKYEPGQERELLAAMRELFKALQASITEDVQMEVEERERLKKEGTAKGQGQLDKGQTDEARNTFNKLMSMFQHDLDLKADIADRYLKANLLQDALKLLEDALSQDPKALFLYNRIGMVLRKLEDYPAAETYYLKALAISDKDEYLYFNLGRLYYDWKQWDKMKTAAEQALALNPGFDQAEKMLQFATKKLG